MIERCRAWRIFKGRRLIGKKILSGKLVSTVFCGGTNISVFQQSNLLKQSIFIGDTKIATFFSPVNNFLILLDHIGMRNIFVVSEMVCKHSRLANTGFGPLEFDN